MERLKLRAAIKRRSEEYRKAVGKARSDKVARELLMDYKRWLCRNDLFY